MISDEWPRGAVMMRRDTPKPMINSMTCDNKQITTILVNRQNRKDLLLHQLQLEFTKY